MNWFAHWFRDSRATYVDPRDGEEKRERRKPWQAVGPGVAFLYAVMVVLVCGALVYAKDISDRFNEQQARTQCLRATLRPIVKAAAELHAGPRLLAAEHAYLQATKGLHVPRSCPR